MGSKRWEAANGQNPAADSLYDPHGNDWYVCAIYGSGASSYASFGIYCACFGPAIHPDGRPFFPRYGRWLSPDSPLLQDLLDPNGLNGYGYESGDPMNGSSEDEGRPNPVWMKLGDTKVLVYPPWPGIIGGMPGVEMQADPQDCDTCRWAQTVKRTGYGAMAQQTDRLPGSGASPLYPSGTPSPNEFWDFPATEAGHAGTFRAVTSLGEADVDTKTFDIKGSITWGYSVDENGNVTPYQARYATPTEQQQSMQVLQRGSPSWNIVAP